VTETNKSISGDDHGAIIFGAVAGLSMIFLSILLENSFRWLILRSFSVTPDGVLISNIFGAVVVVVPAVYAVLLLRRGEWRKGTAAVVLLGLVIICISLVYLARGSYYLAEVERIVFTEFPDVAKKVVASKIILATWVPFLLATGGLFVLGCTAVLWKPQIANAFQKHFEKLRRFPANPQIRWWCWLLVVAALARIVWILLVPSQPVEDFAVYDRYAVRLAEGAGYVSDTGEPTAYWPAGYPLFLSLVYRVFGHSLAAAKAAGIVLGLATVALTYLLGRHCSGERVARIAAIIIALIPGQVVFSNLLATEVLFTPLLLASIYLALRFYRRVPVFFMVGAVAGAAALTRPLALVFPAVLLVFILLRRERVLAAAARFVLVSAGMLVVLSHWLLRNYHVFGKFGIISTNGGFNFYAGNNPDATGAYYIKSGSGLTGKSELERNTEGYSRGMRFIRENPDRFCILGLWKLYYTYGSDLLSMDWSFYSVKNRDNLRVSAVYVTQAAYLVAITAAIAGLCIWLRKRTSGLLLPALAICAWTLIHFIYVGDSKYHYPIVPLLVFFSATAVLRACGIPEREDAKAEAGSE
jgi:4-amino-4-deoxy-L-arabinose transferase-like glycosyltransferase